MEKLINDFSYGLFFWQSLLFIVLLLLLRKFAWNPILNAISEREEGIKNALEEAENARKEMQNLTADNERILKEARIERDTLLKEAREIKENIISEAKGAAQVEATKVIEQAQATIQAEKQAASELLSVMGEKPWFCLHMGARRLALEDKLWSVESFVELTQQLVLDGFTPVLLGVESEADVAHTLCDSVPQTLNLMGKTSMGEMAAVIARAPLLIGHDSGPFHLAVALQTPVVVICPRHDAEPEYLGYDVDSVQVIRGDNPDAIDVAVVYEAAKGLLA